MRPFALPRPCRPVGAVLLAAACLLPVVRARPAGPPIDDKAKPIEANKVELYRLKNDDLLKQAAAIYDKAAQDYLAAGRALATPEILLEEAAKQGDASADAKPPGPPEKEGDVNAVVAVIRQALEKCEHLSGNHGMTVREFTHKADMKEVKYRFWWSLKDYGARNKTRDEVFARISASLGTEEMKGTEVVLA